MDDEIKKFLESGLVYVTGVDHRFRPIIVMNISKVDAK
jgi:hypothetical protein